MVVVRDHARASRRPARREDRGTRLRAVQRAIAARRAAGEPVSRRLVERDVGFYVSGEEEQAVREASTWGRRRAR